MDDEIVAARAAVKREFHAEHLGLLGLVLVVIALPAIIAVQFLPHLNVFPWTYGAIAAICVGVTGNRLLMALTGGAALAVIVAFWALTRL